MSDSTASTRSQYYQSAYQGEMFAARPPWDIGEAQAPFVELAKTGMIKGEVFDAGCGPGELSIFLAKEGFSVTGLDLAEKAVDQARQRAAERGATVEFAVGSVLDLSAYTGRFDTVVDCGTFHALPKDNHQAYTAELHRATKPGAYAHLLEFSYKAREVVKARFAKLGVPEQVRAAFAPLLEEDLRSAFATGWNVESLQESRIKVRFPGDEELTTLPAWLGSFQRL